MRSLKQILNAGQYENKISRPEWKAFASQVRNARGRACESCKRGNVSLQVHHVFYDPAIEPWEYAMGDVVVLCSACHGEIHEQLKSFRRAVFRNLNGPAFKILNGALAVAFEQYQPLVFAHALAEFVSNPRLVQNHAGAWEAQGKELGPKDDGSGRERILEARSTPKRAVETRFV